MVGEGEWNSVAWFIRSVTFVVRFADRFLGHQHIQHVLFKECGFVQFLNYGVIYNQCHRYCFVKPRAL